MMAVITEIECKQPHDPIDTDTFIHRHT